jgi:hypothetical protein
MSQSKLSTSGHKIFGLRVNKSEKFGTGVKIWDGRQSVQRAPTGPEKI